MALRPCPECRRDVASSAKACPACGHTMPRANIVGVVLVLVVAVAAVLAGMHYIDSSMGM